MKEGIVTPEFGGGVRASYLGFIVDKINLCIIE